MKKTAILFFILILGLCSFCFAEEDTNPAQEVNIFSLVQYEDSGEKKWELSGESAEVEESSVKIDQVSALVFGDPSTVKLKARRGDFDRDTQLVHLEGDVVARSTGGTTLRTDSLYWDAEHRNVFTEREISIREHDFEVSGRGAVYDMENETAELKKDVTANITSRETGPLRKTEEATRETIITCDGPLDINYKKNRATFQNNVEVEDAEANIFADRIDVYFKEDTRRVRCIVARGGVRIVNEDTVTYSEKAIYLVDQGRVILPRRPKLVIQSGSIEGF